MYINSLCGLFSVFYEGLKKREEGLTPTLGWLTIKGGNGKLPLALSESLQGKIHFGHPLKAIQKTDQGMTLTFSNQKQIEAEIVLLTIPCSVFNDIEIHPDVIPSHKLEAIQKVQYGTVGKILFNLSLPKDPQVVLAAPNVFSWSNEDHTVRTFYYGGENGIFTSQNVHSFFDQGMTMIRKVYPHISVKQYSLDPPIDKQYSSYKDGVFMSWAYDPYTKGSYANCAKGTYAWLNEIETIRGERVKKVFSPIEDKLFFAGEHTTILDALGTLEGAIESGERVARLIDKSVL